MTAAAATLPSSPQPAIDTRRVLALDVYQCPRCREKHQYDLVLDSPYCRLCDHTGLVSLASYIWYVTTPRVDKQRFGIPPTVRGRSEPLALQAVEMGFADLKDGLGNPLALHSMRVGNAGANSTERTVGYLHDIVRDTCISLKAIRTDFPSHIARAVDALTRRDGETYGDFIQRVCDAGMLEMRVKICDLRDNLSRVHELPLDEAVPMRRRYIIATQMIGKRLGVPAPTMVPNPARDLLLAKTRPI